VYLSDLTFPLFLVHWPVFGAVAAVVPLGVSASVTALILSLALSVGMLEADRRWITPLRRRAGATG